MILAAPRKLNVLGIAILGIASLGWHSNVAGQDDAMARINPRMPPPMPVDAARMEAAGIRRIESTHLVLFTDLPDRPFVDGLGAVFDAAVPQWCQYFGLELERARGWRITAFLMADRDRFRRAGVLPDPVVGVPTGFNLGHHFWVVVQPDDYYTRHLVLHEGTHAFMQWFLAGTGPGWYREGMAELLGLHRLGPDGALTLGARVEDRREVPGWGRVTAIRTALENGRGRSLGEVFDLNQFGFEDVDAYAWSWAACHFLSGHPESAAGFAAMQRECEDQSPRFSAHLRRQLRPAWGRLERDWRLYLDEMEYGVLPDDCRLTELADGVGEDGAGLRLATSHGWQVSGIDVRPGRPVTIAASGRFQVRGGERPWPCEANGITIRYHRGHPLGTLLAGVVVDEGAGFPVQSVQAVGSGGTFDFAVPGRLAFRINEAAAMVGDNEGTLEILVRPAEEDGVDR